MCAPAASNSDRAARMTAKPRGVPGSMRIRATRAACHSVASGSLAISPAEYARITRSCGTSVDVRVASSASTRAGAAIRARHRAAPDRDRSASRGRRVFFERGQRRAPEPAPISSTLEISRPPSSRCVSRNTARPRHKWRACASPGTQPCALRPRCAVGSSRRGKHPTSPQPPVSGMRDYSPARSSMASRTCRGNCIPPL